MHAEQRAIERKKSTPGRRGGTFEELGVALGISNSSLRRWARRGRIVGAHFIRGRWVLLGKLTPKRVETIRSGLNLHEHRPPAPKKWKWRSKEERKAGLQVEIDRLQNAADLLPQTYSGASGMELRRLTAKLMDLEAKLGKLEGLGEYSEEIGWVESEKERRKADLAKLGAGYRRKIVRKRND